MDNSTEHSSAKIYQFPVRGRFAKQGMDRRNEYSAAVAVTACGSGWYHEEAIADDKKHDA